MSGAPETDGVVASGPMLLSGFMPFILVFFVMYFLVLRPQRKKQKETEAMLADLKKGDKVVTSGGVVGIITGVKDDIVVIKIGEGAKLEVLRSHVTEKM